MEASVTLFNSMVAVTIAIPISSGNGSRLSTLISLGTVLTPSADLPSFLSGLSAVSDGAAPVGSSPLTRKISQQSGQVTIENHAAGFTSDYAPTMPQSIARANGTPFTTANGLDGVKRAYVRSAAAAQNVTALCFMMPSAVIDGL